MKNIKIRVIIIVFLLILILLPLGVWASKNLPIMLTIKEDDISIDYSKLDNSVETIERNKEASIKTMEEYKKRAQNDPTLNAATFSEEELEQLKTEEKAMREKKKVKMCKEYKMFLIL